MEYVGILDAVVFLGGDISFWKAIVEGVA